MLRRTLAADIRMLQSLSEVAAVLLLVHYYTLAATVFHTAGSTQDCGERIYSSGDVKTGFIESPNYPNSYGSNLHCMYYLIGRRNERVELIFRHFAVKGVLPSCMDDYVDVYTQVRISDIDDLLSVPLHGRYCGSDEQKLPKRLISMTNVLVLGFYTVSSKETDTESKRKGFRAHYSFIDDSVYNVGTPAADTCGQTVNSVQSGVLVSPTYPGMYPDHVFCFYKIHGSQGERVRLTFTDIDLYSGGEHCPFDYIKVYDGPDNEADEIDTYCGTITDNRTIYSTGPSLNIVFATKSGRAEASTKGYITYDEKEAKEMERRGFRAVFEISDSFVNLDVIEGSHVRGTECDQVIFSDGLTSGRVSSPYYPSYYPLNVRCTYYIDGLQDKQNLEKVNLTITELDIPHTGPGCDNSGYLQIYVDGKMSEEAGLQYCGNNATPPTVTTSNPRLLMVFDGRGHRAGRGFSASYQFITDYAIPGTPATLTQCSFTYRSSVGHKSGPFNSPRHPSNYPHNTDCNYEFIGLSNEQVRITFENFHVENGGADCSRDHVKVFNVAPKRLYSGALKTFEEPTLVGVYCGNSLPGPQMSDENSNQMRVRLKTNEADARSGFSAKYEFIEKSPEKRCVHNLTGSGGDIRSPNHPHKYYTNRTCEWYIYSRYHQGTIMLIIHEFKMEGNPEPGGVGCGNCVLNIYTNKSGLPAYELCGENKSYSGMTILSQDNLMRLKFISSEKAVGGKGFILSWTELLPDNGKSDDKCSSGFRCTSSHYCIAKELQCNKLPNCGHGDTSDETQCGPAHTRSGVLNIILGVVLSAILVIVVAFCVVHLRRRQRRKKHETVTVRFLTRSAVDDDMHINNEQSLPPVSANGGHSLLTEQTEKVSIV